MARPLETTLGATRLKAPERYRRGKCAPPVATTGESPSPRGICSPKTEEHRSGSGAASEVGPGHCQPPTRGEQPAGWNPGARRPEERTWLAVQGPVAGAAAKGAGSGTPAAEIERPGPESWPWEGGLQAEHGDLQAEDAGEHPRGPEAPWKGTREKSAPGLDTNRNYPGSKRGGISWRWRLQKGGSQSPTRSLGQASSCGFWGWGSWHCLLRIPKE